MELDIKFDMNQYFQIKRRIEECDVFYAALYDLAHVEYSNEIETACISFDREGNALQMKINPLFWQGLNEEAKAFVVMHELYHVIYDHAKRMIALELDFNIGNIASDIVINHNLCNKMGIVRELFDWEQFCWVETCFKDEKDIPTDRNFEYYYEKLIKQKNQSQQKLLGSHSDGTQKNKKEQTESSSNKKEEDTEQSFTDRLSEEIKEIIKQNPQIMEDFKESEASEKISPKEMKELSDYINPHSESTPGAKEIDVYRDAPKFAEMPNFDKLMKILIPKKKKSEYKEEETWVGQHRRYASFLKQNNHIFLPNLKEQEKQQKNKKKEVWVFMDTSGSCTGMFPFFSKIVQELLKHKEINCRAFSFDDYCFEIKNKNSQIRASFGNNGGGFDCIEETILETMKKENIKYPDNILVLSDGAVHFRLKNRLIKPENWIMLLNNEYHNNIVPERGKFFLLDEDFFKIKSNKPTFKR